MSPGMSRSRNGLETSNRYSAVLRDENNGSDIRFYEFKRLVLGYPPKAERPVKPGNSEGGYVIGGSHLIRRDVVTSTRSALGG